jgi:hypothetical protein
LDQGRENGKQSKPPVRANKNDLGVSTSAGWQF